MLAMEQPLLCFSPCQNKNTTKNLFTALSFQRLPKVRFLVRRERSPKSKFLRNSIIVSIAPTTTVLLFPLTEHKIRFHKRTLCCALQSAKRKRKASALFQTRIFSARRKAFLNSWVYKKQFEQLKGQHKLHLLHQKSAFEKKAQALIQNNLKEQLHRVGAFESGFSVE